MGSVPATPAPSSRIGRDSSRVFGLLLAVGLMLTATLSGTPSRGDLQIRPSATQFGEPFRAATFNLLGASHTLRASSGFDTYEVRTRRAVRLIRDKGFTIVGLQEFQYPQYDVWKRRVGTTWAAYPGMELGRRPVQNSVIWRTDTWSLVEKHTYQIPYFNGTLVDEPYVKLRNNNTDQSVWVINTHNPANTHGSAERWRNEAEQIQIDLANQLKETGVPVLLVGDFNEKSDAFCNITGNTTLESANPGSWVDGTCVPPRYIRIDWIFHAKEMQSTGYTALDTPRVHRITDHKVIWSDLSIPLS